MTDLGILVGINHWVAASGWAASLAVLFAQGGPFILAGLGLIMWFVLPKTEVRGRRALLYAAVAGVIALVISSAIGVVVFRTRPEFVHPTLVHALIHHANDSSFPSDHASLSLAVGLAMLYAGPVGWVFMALAVLTAVARVAVGVHWPTDVLAGGVLGLIVAWVVIAARGMLERPVVAVLNLFGYGESGRGTGVRGRQGGR